jgi:hypothetical protein
MFTEVSFNTAAADLARENGFSLERAGDYLAAIGDTPELAEDGRAIVRNVAGAELARVRLE